MKLLLSMCHQGEIKYGKLLRYGHGILEQFIFNLCPIILDIYNIILLNDAINMFIYLNTLSSPPEEINLQSGEKAACLTQF